MIKRKRERGEDPVRRWSLLARLTGHPGRARSVQSAQGARPAPAPASTWGRARGAEKTVPGRRCAKPAAAGHHPEPSQREPRLRQGLWGPRPGTQGPKAVGSYKKSLRESAPAPPETVRVSPLTAAGEGGRAATYVQLHQGEQVLLGGSEDGVCLPAADSLVGVGL